MAATYLGSGTIADTVPGLSAALNAVGSALNGLVLAVNVQGDLVLAAKIAIRIPAVASLQASLDGALAINAQLTADLTDPAGYLTVLLQGLATVEASLEVALPTIQLEGTIAANVAISAGLSLQIGAIDLELAALDAIVAALNAAIAAVEFALSLYASITVTTATPGAYVLLDDGPLSGLGAAIDSVTPATGLLGSTTVRAVIILVDASTPALASLNAIFKVS